MDRAIRNAFKEDVILTAIKLTRRRLSLFAPQRYAAFSPGEKPPRFQKLSPELCAVLFPAAKPTTAGQVWHPKKARLRCIIRDRELKPAILENRSTTPSCHDPIGSLVVQLLNLERCLPKISSVWVWIHSSCLLPDKDETHPKSSILH